MTMSSCSLSLGFGDKSLATIQAKLILKEIGNIHTEVVINFLRQPTNVSRTDQTSKQHSKTPFVVLVDSNYSETKLVVLRDRVCNGFCIRS